MQDLRAFGKAKGWCPYFLARHMVQFANVVVYSYQYLLDPKVAGIISKEMQRESVVVFDEAHNIDNVCIEALSVSVRQQTLEGATRNINRMAQDVERCVRLESSVIMLAFVDYKIYLLLVSQTKIMFFFGSLIFMGSFVYFDNFLLFNWVGMVGRFKATDANRLHAEYRRLVDGLAIRGNLPGKL